MRETLLHKDMSVLQLSVTCKFRILSQDRIILLIKIMVEIELKVRSEKLF